MCFKFSKPLSNSSWETPVIEVKKRRSKTQLFVHIQHNIISTIAFITVNPVQATIEFVYETQ